MKNQLLYILSISCVVFLSFLLCCKLVLNRVEPHFIDLIEEVSISPIHGNYFVVETPLVVNLNGSLVIVPKGYKTDLASIPHWAWSFVAPTDGDTVLPSILHDYLYDHPGVWNRKQVDDVFYCFLLKEGVSDGIASQLYLAVRLFGESHFKRGVKDDS